MLDWNCTIKGWFLKVDCVVKCEAMILIAGKCSRVEFHGFVSGFLDTARRSTLPRDHAHNVSFIFC